MPFPITTLTADIRALTDLLLQTPVGGTVTYKDLDNAIGADVRARRYLILRARAVALQESGALFSAVTRVGFQRLHANDAHMIGSHTRRRIRRTTRRTANNISVALAMTNDVSDEARRKAYTEISALQLIQHIATEKAKSAVKDTEKPQPIAITLRNMLAQLGGTTTTT